MLAHRTIVLGLVLAALAGAAVAQAPGSAAPAAAKSARDIRACMSDNLVKRGALRDITLARSDKEGKVGEDLKVRLYWKPSKTGGTRVSLRIVEPAAMAGSSYLLLQEGAGEEVYFALPGADRALRITGQNMSEPLWGTDFSYGEIKQVMGLLVAGDTQRLADTAVAARPSYVLETQTAADAGYKKVVSYVDQASCVLLKSEFVAAGDKPRKVLEGDAATLLQADKYWTILGYTMSDLSRGTRTTLALSDLSIDERLSEKLFSPKDFFRKAP